MDGAAGVEAVGVGRDAAHGMHGDGPANGFVMAAAKIIRPWNVQFNGLVERRMRQLGRDAPHGFGRNCASLRHGFGGIIFACKAFGDQRETGHHLAAISQCETT